MDENRKPLTTLAHSGSAPLLQKGFVNPPVYRGSTVLYETVREMRLSSEDELKTGERVYGRFGSPTIRAFEAAMIELENGYGAVTASSGTAAVATSILAFVASGDHILVPTSAYVGTRRFCDSHLRKMGVETEYYDPLIGAGIAPLIRSNTALVFLESPGSITFEVQDVPAIARVCRAKGVVTLIDNTWATPLYLRPLTLGVDVSVHSASKYICGHADCILGVVVCNERAFAAVRSSAIHLGQYASGDDCSIGLRGLRTLGVRLARHQELALELASWLRGQSQVAKVNYPALAQDAGHSLWRRDFQGATGLFSVDLTPDICAMAADEMIERCRIFGIGSGWGGFESLIMPAGTAPDGNVRLRIHVGLEDIRDLKSDLRRAFG